MWATTAQERPFSAGALPHLIVSRGGLPCCHRRHTVGHRTASGSALPAALTAGYDSAFPMMVLRYRFATTGGDVSAVFGNYTTVRTDPS